MSEPDGGAVELVVDLGLAEPFDALDDYRSAVERVRSASAAYYSGSDLAMDDATYDALLARLAATEMAQPGVAGGRLARRGGRRRWRCGRRCRAQHADAEPGQRVRRGTAA
jgi:hypothetical protein